MGAVSVMRRPASVRLRSAMARPTPGGAGAARSDDGLLLRFFSTSGVLIETVTLRVATEWEARRFERDASGSDTYCCALILRGSHTKSVMLMPLWRAKQPCRANAFPAERQQQLRGGSRLARA
eukprot:3215748-Pleurochrysis_carterae.AAC.1